MTTIGIAVLLLVIVVFMFMMMARKGGSCCGGSPGGSEHAGGGCCGSEGNKEPHDHHPDPESSGHTDPVCGMSVDKESDLTFEYQGKHFAFCSEHCRKSFAADPGKYFLS